MIPVASRWCLKGCSRSARYDGTARRASVHCPSHKTHPNWPDPTSHRTPQRGKSVLGNMSKSWKERYVIADPETMMLTYKEGGAAVRAGTLRHTAPTNTCPLPSHPNLSLSPATPRARSRAHSASWRSLSRPMRARSPMPLS